MMGNVSLEVSRGVAENPPSICALAYEKYHSAEWFDIEKRAKESKIKLSELPKVVSKVTMAEDTTKTVTNFPYLVLWEDGGLIIGWEVHNDAVDVYMLNKGNGNEHVGRLLYRNGKKQEFVTRVNGLSNAKTGWDIWVQLVQLFPQLKTLELINSERSEGQSVSMVATIIAQNEVKIMNHINAMVRKTIRTMEALDDNK